MNFVKNYAQIASNESRKIVLNIIESGLASIQFDSVLSKNFSVTESNLQIKDKIYDLKNYERIFLLGFGKGSAAVSKIIENTLGDKLTKGFDIDVVDASFNKIEYVKGTHPLPSAQNLEFSSKAIESLSGLTEKDLVLVVICGGGSVMFEYPFSVDLQKLIDVNSALLATGADIYEMNTLRKHLSVTKGGGLVKKLSPAKVISLIFSDVPGNDLSFIASGPTVKDLTTVNDAFNIIKKYSLDNLNLSTDNLTETPKEDRLFNNVDNILMLSNLTALNAMKLEAEKWGIKAEIFSDQFKSDTLTAAKTLIEKTPSNSILLAGGETTVKVGNPDGKGGRNQDLVLAALPNLPKEVIIASVNSDGWDNTPAAGAVGDSETILKAKDLEIDPVNYFEACNSYLFFNATEDAIITDRLPANVADLIIVYRR